MEQSHIAATQHHRLAGLTAYATEAREPALAGVLLELVSPGSALGGLTSGGLLLEQFRSGATLATAAVSALLAALGARFVLGRLRGEG